jgi:hypothetical protein
MRYMVMVKANSDYEAGVPPSPALMAAIGKLAEKEARKGRLVQMGGLMRARKGKVRVVDGPFAEAKELVGGYAIFEVKSKAEILEMATEFMQVHVDVLGPDFEGEVEVREIIGGAPPG